MEETLRENLLKTRQELERKLQEPAVFQNPQEYRDIARRYKEVVALLEKLGEKERLEKELREAEGLIEQETDPEVRAFLTEEVERLRRRIRELDRGIHRALLPRDPEDEGNAVMEIRAGAGGEEAALFARDLFRMYQRYAERKGWRVSVTDIHETDLGGIREIVFLVEGKGAYGRLKYESGVHRVQRIPVTESGGRIHTSTASVVVLPEWEEIEVEIRPEDLKIETFRASGPGGQHVNVTDSAVRITHIPTGIVVSVQDERSQHKNRAKAMRILKARLYDRMRQEQAQKMASIRKTYIGTGDRSEKIRTYNFPQNRVTDHRIGLTLYTLERILDGELDPLIEALLEAEEQKKLQALASAEANSPLQRN